MIGRRETLRLLAAGAATWAAGVARGAGPGATTAAGAAPGEKLGAKAAPRPGHMPVIFVAHGAPPLLDIPTWVDELHRWAGAMPRPKAILVLSAHWEQRPATVGATRTVPLVRDFYGFPERYYRQEYPAPGAPALAERVRQLLAPLGPVAASDRGLDHGAYVPLVAMYPAADVPVLQVSLPGLEPATMLAMGRALAPLRGEGVLIEGSGFITHNLRAVDPRLLAPTPAWAQDFDAWTAEALVRRDVDGLAEFLARGPGARESLPTTEHFAPLLAALGAAGDDAPSFPISGFWMGSLTRRSVRWG